MIGGQDEDRVLALAQQALEVALEGDQELIGLGVNRVAFGAVAVGERVDVAVVEEVVGRAALPGQHLAQPHQRLRQGLVIQCMGLPMQGLAGGVTRIVIGLQDKRIDSSGTQSLMDVRGRKELVSGEPKGGQGVAGFVGWQAERQRQDCGVKRRFVLVPLINTRLSRCETRMNRGDVRGSGGRKHRGQS